jgi:sucrose-phosphate synthase
MSSDNAQAMEARFRFSRRIAAERLAMERATAIITSTDQERTDQYGHPLYRGAIDVDDPKFNVIPPGVNTRVFSTERGAVDAEVSAKLRAGLARPDRPVLLVSSRLDEKKNIGGAVSAWAGSERLRQRAGLVLCIRGMDDPFEEIGTLDEAEQRVLRPVLDTIESGGLRDEVTFLNIGSQAELAATYRYFARRDSTFVLTSFYEPFGLAPIEAAACGLSCVATRNGGPSEIFADGSGVLVDPEDVADIERGLFQALEGHEDLARRSRARVLDLYTWERTAERYLAVAAEGARQGAGSAEAIPELDASGRIADWLNATW